MRKTFFVIFTMALLAVISGFIHSSSSKLPQLFKGMNAEYEFSGQIAISNGQIVYSQTSRSSWTVLDLNESTASVKADFIIVLVEGEVPGSVAAAFNPFPSGNWTQEFEFDLSESIWNYYLSDASDDLMRYKVGEEVVSSNVGSVDSHHLQVRNPLQQWDAFYDRSSGILISLQETLSVSDHEVEYSYLIVDTNAALSMGSEEPLGFIDVRFLILGVLVAVSGAIALVLIKRRSHERRRVNVSEPVQMILSDLGLAFGENE